MKDINIVKIFDSTLRDGEQSPGVSLNVEEKVKIAKQLIRLKVDVIEAGFPITSVGDFEAVQAIARRIKGATICALARTVKGDIDRAYEAIKESDDPRIHTFIATSDIHLKHKLRKSREEVLEQAYAMVKYAKQYTANVEFSAEDATRSDREYLRNVIERAIEAGAVVVNIPDTVGYTTPIEFGGLINFLATNVKNIDQATISVHCHNDLGLAVANSLSAALNGARQIECTVNGIGERAGNCSLEEVVMGMTTRSDFYPCQTNINLSKIYPTSRMVSSLTGMVVQPNKAIVGANAFAHESGIHQDGVLKERSTYEIMSAESIGLPTNKLVLGKHSGRHAFRERLIELGFTLSEEAIEKTFVSFKELADKKKHIFDEDIEALVEEVILEIPETFSLKYVYVASGTETAPEATVELVVGDQKSRGSGGGDGPVDAVFNVIARLTKTESHLKSYAVNAITGGTDAQGEVTVQIAHDKITVSGRGADTDIIIASAKAYVHALNRLEHRLQLRNKNGYGK